MYLHRILAFFFFFSSSCFHSDSVSNTEGTGQAAFPLEDVTCRIYPPICVPFMKAVPHSGPDVGFRACQTWLCFPAGVSLARLLSALWGCALLCIFIKDGENPTGLDLGVTHAFQRIAEFTNTASQEIRIPRSNPQIILHWTSLTQSSPSNIYGAFAIEHENRRLTSCGFAWNITLYFHFILVLTVSVFNLVIQVVAGIPV